MFSALKACTPPKQEIEVIVVINAAENASQKVLTQNEKTCCDLTTWAEKEKPAFRIFVLRDEDLPPKHAGVGLARKIGMDEAAWRFESIGNKEGIIVCLDADCTVAPNYLSSIEDYFTQYPATKAASIYFEHPREGTEEVLNEGITNYELHLRYYRQSLKYAGYPYHYHTIGSSMCVRSDVYQQAGGMNRRKAGEDFYFLHKIIPLGNFGEINTTTVFPSPRISERVPFGTGRAMKEWMNGKEKFVTYNPEIFSELKTFLGQIPFFFRLPPEKIESLTGKLPRSISSYLASKDFIAKVEEVSANVSNRETFVLRLLNWFDGFNVLKLVHYARDNFYPNIEVEEAAKKLLEKLNTIHPKSELLLDIYRRLDRTGYA
jgi:hypothetical protein